MHIVKITIATKNQSETGNNSTYNIIAKENRSETGNNGTYNITLCILCYDYYSNKEPVRNR